MIPSNRTPPHSSQNTHAVPVKKIAPESRRRTYTLACPSSEASAARIAGFAALIAPLFAGALAAFLSGDCCIGPGEPSPPPALAREVALETDGIRCGGAGNRSSDRATAGTVRQGRRTCGAKETEVNAGLGASTALLLFVGGGGGGAAGAAASGGKASALLSNGPKKRLSNRPEESAKARRHRMSSSCMVGSMAFRLSPRANVNFRTTLLVQCLLYTSREPLGW